METKNQTSTKLTKHHNQGASMNAVTEAAQLDQRNIGLYHKFNVTRTDGSSEPGGKHHGDEHFVLNLTTDCHAIPAIKAYAQSCANDYPALAADLRAKIGEAVVKSSVFVTVPEVTLPSGAVVPSFQVGKYLTSHGPNDLPQITADGAPWVEIDYHAAKAAAETVGLKLITETQYLALAHDIARQDINWTGGKVGKGALFQGLRNDSVDEAQPGAHEPKDPDERRWFELSNGERIYDVAGNAYSWVFDDVQGDESGIVARAFAVDSPSISNLPTASMEKGIGWYPPAGRDWSSYALVRGGCWRSGGNAGAFDLDYGWPGSEYGDIGFRCTKP